MARSRTVISPLMEDILNALPDGVFISDADGTTLYVNRMYEQLTGFSFAELRGKSVNDIVSEGGFDLALNPEIVRGGTAVSRVQTLRSGKKLMLSGVPVFDKAGNVMLVCTFVRDVTTLDALRDRVESQRRQIHQIQGDLDLEQEEGPIVRSPAMRKVLDLVARVAATDATLLLLGETGVGKDVLARHAHQLSPRHNGPFIKVDCGGIAETLIESEMFGYEPGAFTGALQKGRIGYFEQAKNGTVYLDEVGELSMPMQTRLLRVLQDGEFVRVGGSKPIKTNVRIIAATNRDLAQSVENGSFRRDLFYRLNVASVVLPPLRERRDAIRPLVHIFLERFCKKYRKRLTFVPAALDTLEHYSWPGNVRELQNLIHSLVITSKGTQISRRELPPQITGNKQGMTFSSDDIHGGRRFHDIMAEVERDFLLKAIRYHGSVPKVAKLFKIDRSTIFRKLRKTGLTAKKLDDPK